MPFFFIKNITKQSFETQRFNLVMNFLHLRLIVFIQHFTSFLG